MSDHTNPHWVRDAERLDRYLRGEVSTGERSEMDAHLLGCPECAQVLASERALVDGIRSFGRAALRRDLAGLLAARTRRRAAAYRWLGAAAVVILAVAIWYIPGEAPPVPVIVEQPKPVPSTQDEVSEPKKESGEAGIEEERARRSEHRQSTPRERIDMMADRDASAGAGAPAAPSAEVQEQVLSASSAAPPLSDIGSWFLAREESAAQPNFGKVLRDQAALQRSQEAMPKSNLVPPLSTAVVTQGSPRDVAEWVRAMAGTDDEAMPVRVQEAQDTLHVKVFPEEPFLPEVLAAARVVRIDPDSLALRIGGKSYGVSRARSLPVR